MMYRGQCCGVSEQVFFRGFEWTIVKIEIRPTEESHERIFVTLRDDTGECLVIPWDKVERETQQVMIGPIPGKYIAYCGHICRVVRVTYTADNPLAIVVLRAPDGVEYEAECDGTFIVSAAPGELAQILKGVEA